MTLEINEEPADIEDLNGKSLAIKITPERKKRSLDSNAYFHVLCDKLRQKLGMSMIRMKHILISEYGQLLYINDIPQEMHSEIPVDFLMEQEFYDAALSLHFSFIGCDADGLNVYRIYRGSHTYNSAEMAMLIDGAVAECKEQGIETATPEQLARMAALWEQRRKE